MGCLKTILQWGYCNRLRPFVRPSRYLLLYHRTKSTQIWCVSCSHEWGAQRHNFFFDPAPRGPEEGTKGQISLNFNYKVNLKILNQTLCVFSQMKDITHIRRDLGHAPGVGLRGTEGFKNLFFPKFNQILCVSYSHVWHMQRHHFWSLGPWGGTKRSNIIKS